jgi:hypothetical protein
MVKPFRFLFQTLGLVAPEISAPLLGLQMLTNQLNEYSAQQHKATEELSLKIQNLEGIMTDLQQQIDALSEK